MRYNHFSMLPERAFQPRNGRYGMTLEGGGGGGPTSSTVTQTNIPEWLRPQTEALLGAATQEYFQTKPVGGKPAVYDSEGNLISEAVAPTYEITGVKPFTPYSTRPQDYVAGFSPLQEQVMREAAGMQRPEGFERGSEMAGMAGQGGLESAGKAYGYGQAGFGAGQRGEQIGARGGQRFGEAGFESGRLGQLLGTSRGELYGGLGAGYGAQAAGMVPEAQMYGRTAADIGQMGLRAEALGRDVGEEARQYARQAAGMGGMYERMATSPYAVSQYMSPYQQAVTDMQVEAARRQADISRTQRRSAAARAGAFGGSRQAIEEAEANRALQTQLQNIQAQGLQSAYDKAIQSMQYGVGTGLQGLSGAQAGLGTALSGGQLGLSGIGQALAGQQAGLAGLGQAGQLYGLGMQGAGMGLQGLQQQLAGTAQGMQGAQVGLSGIDRMLAGTAQGMQGAGVGLQGVSGAQAGYGLANTAAANLANIAKEQQAADIARMQFQAQQGALQQAQEQAITNQAVQNYAMAQQHAQQQLSGYNALLRGYATPTTTVQQYQAAPSAVSQLAGLGTAGIGLAGMANMAGVGRKKGGKIKDKDGIDDLMIRKTLKKVAA